MEPISQNRGAPQHGDDPITVNLLIRSDVDPVLYKELTRLAKGRQRTSHVRALLTKALADEARLLIDQPSAVTDDELIKWLEFDPLL